LGPPAGIDRPEQGQEGEEKLMSARWTNKKHGLRLGHGPFMAVQGASEAHDWMVEFENYGLEYTPYNVHIMTPALQLCWEADERMRLVINPQTRQWLDANAPGWGAREPTGPTFAHISFPSKRQADEFIDMVCRQLDGIPTKIRKNKK
jgi:hypothetical protein